jgi:hypothetical protein
MDNGKWTIEVVRSSGLGSITGWLVSRASGQRYVFSVRGAEVHFMREVKPPTNIPQYIKDYLLNLRDSLQKDA